MPSVYLKVDSESICKSLWKRKGVEGSRKRPERQIRLREMKQSKGNNNVVWPPKCFFTLLIKWKWMPLCLCVIERCCIANSLIVWISSFRREKGPADFSHRYFFLVWSMTLPRHSPTCLFFLLLLFNIKHVICQASFCVSVCAITHFNAQHRIWILCRCSRLMILQPNPLRSSAYLEIFPGPDLQFETFGLLKVITHFLFLSTLFTTPVLKKFRRCIKCK